MDTSKLGWTVIPVAIGLLAGIVFMAYLFMQVGSELLGWTWRTVG